MRGRFILIALAGTMTALALCVGSAAGSPGADSQLATKASLFSTAVDPLQEELAIDAMASSTSGGTKHYGPFPSSSGDSGTCGPDWAEDTFDRFFTVRQSGSNTYAVYEQFKNGTFVTNAGFSPGACDNSDGYGPGLVTAGLTGTMHGYFIIDVTCPTSAPCLSPLAACGGSPDVCATTAGFIATFFGALATYDIGTYFFHYAGKDDTNQELVVHEWKNASCNRGGNHGDIATSATTVLFTFPVC